MSCAFWQKFRESNSETHFWGDKYLNWFHVKTNSSIFNFFSHFYSLNFHTLNKLFRKLNNFVQSDFTFFLPGFKIVPDFLLWMVILAFCPCEIIYLLMRNSATNAKLYWIEYESYDYHTFHKRTFQPWPFSLDSLNYWFAHEKYFWWVFGAIACVFRIFWKGFFCESIVLVWRRRLHCYAPYNVAPPYLFRRTKNRILKAKIQVLPVIAAQLDHVIWNLHQKYFHFTFSECTQSSSFKSLKCQISLLWFTKRSENQLF